MLIPQHNISYNPKFEIIYLPQHRTLVYGSFWLYVPCNWQVAEILLNNSPGPICFTFLVQCTSFANLVNFNLIYVPGCRPQHESHYHYWFVLHFCFSQRSFLCIGECLKCVGSNVCLNNKGIFFSIVTMFYCRRHALCGTYVYCSFCIPILNKIMFIYFYLFIYNAKMNCISLSSHIYGPFAQMLKVLSQALIPHELFKQHLTHIVFGKNKRGHDKNGIT